MSFGLKNLRATYQRLMDTLFYGQIWQNLEVYIDDMVIKTLDKGRHEEDLKETLIFVKRFNMQLNPNKCLSRVWARKFLG